ncbi:MFS general substrate transporter [Sistotremastrum suecicum HHB10207 ss-3]|uniref:MFS general substrate transporter n=1 Tax=Sistotremastrum suecicum HHB10207 ss-3 TaxID=1314776 RepID=A0A166HUB9_9AGAM|nr:MFS general substrate transporter [Sistotremastrum suecicum HHB10207 ss-3]
MSRVSIISRKTTLSTVQESKGKLVDDQVLDEQNEPDVDTDGGLEGWLTVLGAFLVQVVNMGHATGFAAYEEFYKTDYLDQVSSSGISWIGSTQVSLLSAMSLVSGPLFDKGYFRYMMSGSSVFYALCNFMLSLAHRNKFYQVYLPQGLGLGLAMGFVYSPTMAVVSRHFHRRRSFAIGLVASGSSMGGVLYPIMLNHLFKSVGFRKAVLINASMNTTLLAIANFLIHEYPKLSASKTLELKSRSARRPIFVWSFFRELPYMLMVIGLCISAFGFFFPTVYIQLFAVTKGLPAGFAFYVPSILNGAAFFGRIVPNYFADRLGIFTMVLPCLAAMCGTIFALIPAHTAGGVAAVAAVYGFFWGAYAALTPAALASLAKNNEEVGARVGVGISFTAISLLGGIPISGALLTNQNHWTPPVLFSGLTIIIGTACWIACRVLLLREKSRAKAPDSEMPEMIMSEPGLDIDAPVS